MSKKYFLVIAKIQMDVFNVKITILHGFLLKDIFKNGWKDSVFKIIFCIINKREFSGDLQEIYDIKFIKLI